MSPSFPVDYTALRAREKDYLQTIRVHFNRAPSRLTKAQKAQAAQILGENWFQDYQATRQQRLAARKMAVTFSLMENKEEIKPKPLRVIASFVPKPLMKFFALLGVLGSLFLPTTHKKQNTIEKEKPRIDTIYGGVSWEMTIPINGLPYQSTYRLDNFGACNGLALLKGDLNLAATLKGNKKIQPIDRIDGVFLDRTVIADTLDQPVSFQKARDFLIDHLGYQKPQKTEQVSFVAQKEKSRPVENSVQSVSKAIDIAPVTAAGLEKKDNAPVKLTIRLSALKKQWQDSLSYWQEKTIAVVRHQASMDQWHKRLDSLATNKAYMRHHYRDYKQERKEMHMNMARLDSLKQVHARKETQNLFKNKIDFYSDLLTSSQQEAKDTEKLLSIEGIATKQIIITPVTPEVSIKPQLIAKDTTIEEAKPKHPLRLNSFFYAGGQGGNKSLTPVGIAQVKLEKPLSQFVSLNLGGVAINRRDNQNRFTEQWGVSLLSAGVTTRFQSGRYRLEIGQSMVPTGIYDLNKTISNTTTIGLQCPCTGEQNLPPLESMQAHKASEEGLYNVTFRGAVAPHVTVTAAGALSQKTLVQNPLSLEEKQGRQILVGVDSEVPVNLTTLRLAGRVRQTQNSTSFSAGGGIFRDQWRLAANTMQTKHAILGDQKTTTITAALYNMPRLKNWGFAAQMLREDFARNAEQVTTHTFLFGLRYQAKKANVTLSGMGGFHDKAGFSGQVGLTWTPSLTR